MEMKTLVTGGTGRLGRELVKQFPDCLHPSSIEFDITSRVRVNSYFWWHNIGTVVHAAAKTSVQRCEEYRNEAYETNVVGTRNLVEVAQRESPECYFVLVSTACVFKGDRGNYTEKDAPDPKNYYSLTKRKAEEIVENSGLSHLIVRTNFVAREPWPYPAAFIDRYGTYLYADDVARAIKQLVDQHMTGVVHVCGDKKMSMFELAKLTTPDVQPLTLKEYVESQPHTAPLTVDMTLVSIRIPPFRISEAGS